VTLIAVCNSKGCVGRCDAKCYNAAKPECDCICGGANHGRGLDKARANVEVQAVAMLEDWQTRHPDLSNIASQALLL